MELFETTYRNHGFKFWLWLECGVAQVVDVAIVVVVVMGIMTTANVRYN